MKLSICTCLIVQDGCSFVTFCIDRGESLEGLVGLLVEQMAFLHVVGNDLVKGYMLLGH